MPKTKSPDAGARLAHLARHLATWTRANAIRMRARAWAAYPAGAVLAQVTDRGEVYVWDDCACRWTANHCLSQRSIDRARSLAARCL